MKAKDYDQLLANASEATRRLNSPVVAGSQAAQPQHRPVPALAGSAQIQGRSPSRRGIRVTIATRRLRDPDNTVVKWIIDALRYNGIIPDDREQDITLEVKQVKVGSQKFEGTLIEVE